MSVIQRIRDKGAWIMLVLIALALIAFILQDGLGRGRGSGVFDGSSTIGSVNGIKITKEEFDTKVTQNSGNGQSKDNVIPSVWNGLVYEIIQRQEYDKLGLTVSNKELSDYLYGPQSPLASIPQLSFLKSENGQLDPAKAQEWFANIKKGKDAEATKQITEFIIEPAIKQLLDAKYQALLQKSAYVPTWMVEKQKAENAAISSFSYVYVPYSSITDTTIKATDADVMAYVKKHAKLFEKDEESRTFSYVSFDAAASNADSMAALNQVLSLKNEFAAATDAKAFLAKAGTELPYANAYYMKNQLKMPKADSITALAVGQLYGPYLDGSNYVVAKMIGKKVMPDSVKVRHILVKTEEGGQPVLSDSIAKRRIDSVEALAKSGTDFDQLVQKYSDDEGSKKTKGEYDFSSTQFITISKEFAEAAFYGKTGDKKVVKVGNDKYAGYHYMEVISQKGIGEAVNVAYLAKPIVVSNETSSAASTAALQFAASAKNKEQFEENAKKLNKVITPSQEVKESDFSLPAFGQSSAGRTVIRWVFENEVGAINQPVDMGDKFIVPIITSISKKGLVSVSEARPRVSQLIINEKKAKKIIEEKFKGSTLESYAASAGVPVQKADSVSLSNPSIPNIGYEMAVLGAAFNKDFQGKASSPIAGNSGVIALQVVTIGAKPVVADNEQIRQQLLQTMRNASGRSTEALRKAATVKDNRMKMNY